MKSTRERVLETLLTRGKCTINELAESVDINPISVRHHITRLEAEGMVDSVEERHGVGRPRRLYFLTDEGREQFPTRYLNLTKRLLDKLKETMPEDLVNNLFEQMAEDIADDYQEELSGLPINKRLDLVKNLLTDEGFTVEWEKVGKGYEIRESNCPYFHVGEDHPEICAVDQTLITSLLQLPVKKTSCKLSGDPFCTYIVTESSEMEPIA